MITKTRYIITQYFMLWLLLWFINFLFRLFASFCPTIKITRNTDQFFYVSTISTIFAASVISSMEFFNSNFRLDNVLWIDICKLIRLSYSYYIFILYMVSNMIIIDENVGHENIKPIDTEIQNHIWWHCSLKCWTKPISSLSSFLCINGIGFW